MRYIAYFLDLALVLFIIVLCGAFFSLGDERTIPINLSLPAKIIGEVVYYVLVLFLFFTERRVELGVWLRSILMFIFLRVIISLGNAFVFRFISAETQISFPRAYSDAFFGYLPVYIIQVLTTPFLAYPLIMEYIRSKLREEEETEPVEVPQSPLPFVLKPDAPQELSTQVIRAKKWRRLVQMTDEQEVDTLLSGMVFAPSVKKVFENVMHMERIGEFLESIVSPVKSRPVEQVDEFAPPPVAPTVTLREKPTATSQAEELSELEKLLQTAEQPEKQISPMEATPSALEEEITTPPTLEIQETEILPTAAPEMSIPEIKEEPQIETLIEKPEKTFAEFPILEPPPQKVSGPTTPSVTADQSPKTETPSLESKPTPPPKPAPPPQIPAPAGGYSITSAEDSFRISVRKLIELNKDKQPAQILERLIKRGADFELSVPMTFLIPQLREGKAEISVEQIYNEIPLELVNFMSSDASGDLSSQIIALPIKEIMQMTDPVVIFGAPSSGQKESPWAKATEELGVDKIFGDSVPESVTQEAPIVEDERKTLDLTKATQVQAPEPSVEKERAPKDKGFDEKFLELARHWGVVPQYEKCDKIGVITLAALGVPLGTAKVLAEKVATTRFSPEWVNAPCYMVVWTPHAIIGFRVAPGFFTKRDCVILVSSYRPIHEFYDMLEMSAESTGKTTASLSLEVTLSELQPLPLPEERSAQYGNYSGYWAKLPGLSLILLSPTGGDEDFFGQLASSGKEIASAISGAGGIFTGWQKALLWCSNWAMAVLPMPGGHIIAALPSDMSLPQLAQEVEQLAQKILGDAK